MLKFVSVIPLDPQSMVWFALLFLTDALVVNPGPVRATNATGQPDRPATKARADDANDDAKKPKAFLQTLLLLVVVVWLSLEQKLCSTLKRRFVLSFFLSFPLPFPPWKRAMPKRPSQGRHKKR